MREEKSTDKKDITRGVKPSNTYALERYSMQPETEAERHLSVVYTMRWKPQNTQHATRMQQEGRVQLNYSGNTLEYAERWKAAKDLTRRRV